MNYYSIDRAVIVRLPFFLYSVQAGFPSPADDYIEARLDLNERLIKHESATFVVKASGHSMRGAGINDGDLLIVDRSISAQKGMVVIAAVDGDLTVKRLSEKNGMPILMAENNAYPDIEIQEGQELEIWGVVTSVIHEFL